MRNLWVYKLDGSVKCGGNKSTSVDEDAMQLELLIGKNIIENKKAKLPIPFAEVCGAPTGMANAFLISHESAYLLFNGTIGPSGFSVWLWDPPADQIDGKTAVLSTNHLFDIPVPWPWDGKVELEDAAFANFIASVTQVGSHPIGIIELLGRRCRTYKTGDTLTLDYVQNRVNIETSKDSIIQKIWFG